MSAASTSSSSGSNSGQAGDQVSALTSQSYNATKDIAQGLRKSVAAPTQTAQRKDKPLYSLIAGATAGAVEGFATYPIEYTKTVSQFAAKAGERAPGPISIVRTTLAKDGFIGLYSGCGALVTGNALKAGVRFLAYDHFKSLLKDESGKLSGPRSLLAGLGAGMMEAVFAVTPSETIKTKLIDDGKRAVPKYPRGLIPGTAAIVKEEGLRGIYRGLFPVMLRQGANSAVRFGTYSTLKNFVSGGSRPGQSLPGGITFGIGAVAGIVTVCKYLNYANRVGIKTNDFDASRYDNASRCGQDENADARGAHKVPQHVQLFRRDAARGGHPCILAWRYATPCPSRSQRRHCIHRLRGDHERARRQDHVDRAHTNKNNAVKTRVFRMRVCAKGCSIQEGGGTTGSVD